MALDSEKIESDEEMKKIFQESAIRLAHRLLGCAAGLEQEIRKVYNP